MQKLLSIKAKLFGGVGVIALALAVTATLAVFGLGNVQSIFADYRAAARQSLEINAVTSDFTSARQGVMKYRLSFDQKDADAVRTSVAEIRAAGDDIKQLFKDPARIAALDALSDNVATYEEHFGKFEAVQSQIEKIQTELYDIGLQIRQNLTAIIESAFLDGDQVSSYYAGRAQEQLLQSRVYAERLFATQSEEAYKKASGEATRANKQIKDLIGKLETSEHQKLAKEAVAQSERTLQLLEELSAKYAGRREYRENGLDLVGPQLMAGYSAILTDVVGTQNTLGPKATNDIEAILRKSVV